MLRTLSLFFVASIAVACGGSDGSDLLGGDPVGVWRELPNQADDDPPDPIDERQVLEFAADGTFVEIEGGGEEPGTWQISDGRLTLTAGGDDPFTVPYRVSGDRFVLGALTPIGSNERGIGTWTATVEDISTGATGDTLTTTIDIRSDNTATIDYQFSAAAGEDETYEATWTSAGDDFRVTFMFDETTTVNLHTSFVDGVMGSPYERI